MKRTPNLNLPIYNTPETDRFLIEDLNTAYSQIDYAYGVAKEVPNVNASAEVADARLGEENLGTFNRKIKERIADVFINVKDFGAKGDGTNDDTEAIQLALEQIKENGFGKLYFPKGIYNTRFPIEVPCDYFTLEFETENTVIKATNIMDAVVIDKVGHPYTTFIGVNLNANKKATNCYRCIENYAPYSRFSRCTFNNSIEECFRAKVYMTSFDRCNAKNGKGGFLLEPNSGNIVTSITMNSCYANTMEEYGYKFVSACYSSLNGCGCDNIPNGTAYIINGRGIALNGCGCENVKQAMLAPSFRGVSINSFYMQRVGGEEGTPTEYLFEFVSGSSATICNVQFETMKQYNYVIGLTGNSYGYENISILDDSIKKTQVKQIGSTYVNGTNAIQFLRGKEYVNKNITCDISELQQKLDELHEYIYATNITFTLTNNNNFSSKLSINSKKDGRGTITLDFTGVILNPTSSIGAMDITNVKCNLIIKGGTFNQTSSNNFAEIVRFIGCGNVSVDGSTIVNSSGGKGGSAISAINGSCVKVCNNVITTGTFESDSRLKKFNEDNSSIIINRTV